MYTLQVGRGGEAGSEARLHCRCTIAAHMQSATPEVQHSVAILFGLALTQQAE